jgi:hypothetical protein
MTSKRFIHKRRFGKYSREKSAMMNKARWDADRARRDAEMPARIRELAEIEAINLPRRQGDAIGCLQWTDFRTGKIRRWVIRIGNRRDRITVESPGNKPSPSHGWTWFLTQLRKHLS